VVLIGANVYIILKLTKYLKKMPHKMMYGDFL